MTEQNLYVDLSGVPKSSSSRDRSSLGDDAPHASTENTHADRLLPPQRSTTGSPRQSVVHNGDNGDNNSTRSLRGNMDSSCGTVLIPGGVPLRPRESKHPFFVTRVSPSTDERLGRSGTELADSDAEHARPQRPPQQNNSSEGPLYRASAHCRRHSPSVAVLHRDTLDPTGPVNIAVSASPDQPAAATATTQEDVKRYVATVMADHAANVSTWAQRVTVAEIYRDKPRRTGGLPAPLRVQDRNFLERIASSLNAHQQQLADARSLLLQTRKSVPPTKSGGCDDRNAWDEYCSCYEQTLIDLTSETKQVRKRVDRLLKQDQPEGMRAQRTRAGSVPQSGSGRASRGRSQGSVASRHNSPQATPRGQRRASTEQQGETTHTDPTAQATETPPNGYHKYSNGSAAATPISDHNPYVSHFGGGAVQRGSPAIRPGYNNGGSESVLQASPTPQTPPPRIPTSSNTQKALAGSVSSALSLTSSRSQLRTRALHPDTVVRLSVPTASFNDLQSPYGHLLSPKRTSSSLRDPTHAVLVVPPPTDTVAAEMTEEADAPVTVRSYRASRASRASCASRASRTSRAVSSTNPASDMPPQLRTYSSPRGSARSAAVSTSATPTLDPTQRRRLLEMIEQYERNSATLKRTDLHRARECFYQLYGEQQGLHQYCLWVDDIALSALRVMQNSA